MKKNITFIIFVLAVCLSASSVADNSLNYVYVCSFSVAILSLYLIKNALLSFALSVAAIVLSSIYQTDYAFFMVPIFLLIVIYKRISKKIFALDSKKRNHIGTENVLLQILAILSTIEGLYFVIIGANDNFDFYIIKDFKFGSIILLLLTIIFIISAFSKNIKSHVIKNYKLSKEDYLALTFLNFVSILLFATSILYNCVKYEHLKVSCTNLYFPWAVWFCVLIYEKNPIIETGILFFENTLKKISDRMESEK